MGTKLVGDQIGWGPNWLGTKLLGTKLVGDQILGDHFSMGTKFDGDRCWSRGTGSGGPEVRGSNRFRTKCVAAHNLLFFKILSIIECLEGLFLCFVTTWV